MSAKGQWAMYKLAQKEAATEAALLFALESPDVVTQLPQLNVVAVNQLLRRELSRPRHQGIRGQSGELRDRLL